LGISQKRFAFGDAFRRAERSFSMTLAALTAVLSSSEKERKKRAPKRGKQKILSLGSDRIIAIVIRI
jgi:hypothetical protein